MKSTDKVLVTGAAGGVGHIAVQWAKKKGCYVVGTCSNNDKRGMLESIGCDKVVNYKDEKLIDIPKDIDVIFETQGGHMRNVCWSLLKEWGRMVVIGSVSEDYEKINVFKQDLSSFSCISECKQICGFMLLTCQSHPRYKQVYAQMLEGLSKGDIKIMLDPNCEKFKGIKDIYNAQKLMRKGVNIGKMYVTISEE